LVGDYQAWHATIRTARYLGVAPWDLDDRFSHLIWQMLAYESLASEAAFDAYCRRNQEE
jgi:hypothetical protein